MRPSISIASASSREWQNSIAHSGLPSDFSFTCRGRVRKWFELGYESRSEWSLGVGQSYLLHELRWRRVGVKLVLDQLADLLLAQPLRN